jgi:hypothetical protein
LSRNPGTGPLARAISLPAYETGHGLVQSKIATDSFV